MRAYSAHNCSHVNAPALYRFAQSYIIGSARFGGSLWRPRRFLRERIESSARAARTPLGGAVYDAHQRTRPLSRSATHVNKSRLTSLVRLSYLGPEIVRALLADSQSNALTPSRLLRLSKNLTSDDSKTDSRDPAAVRAPHPDIWRLWLITRRS